MPTKTRVRVIDKAALAEVLRELRGDRPQRQIADLIGIQQSAYSKLERGTQDYIERTTYEGIGLALGGEVTSEGTIRGPTGFAALSRTSPGDTPQEEAEREKDALLEQERRPRRAREAGETPKSVEEMEAERQYEALRELRLFDRFQACILTDDDEWALQNYHHWLRTEVERLRLAFGDMFEGAWDNPTTRVPIKGFLKKTLDSYQLPPASEARIWLALYRVFEPLAASAATWGMEVSWADLREEQQRDYLNGALKAEVALLGREPDLQRVKYSEPPMSYWDALGMLEVQEQFLEDNPGATLRDWDDETPVFKSWADAQRLRMEEE